MRLTDGISSVLLRDRSRNVGRRYTWLFDACSFLLSCGITAIVAIDPGRTDAVAMLYIWVGLIACYFLSFWHETLQISAIGVLYGAELVWKPVPDRVEHWVALMGTLVVLGPLVALVQHSVQQLVESLQDGAVHDPLTGLANRRGFAEALDIALEAGSDVVLIKGDVDLFTVLNDELGSREGDKALLEIAEILTARGGEGRCVARMGGEEFAIIAHGLDEGAAYAMAEGIRLEIDEHFASRPVQITMSIGVGWREAGDLDEAIVAEADQALRAAKATGRNQTVVFGDEVVSLMPRLEARVEAQRALHLGTMLTLARVLDMRDTSTSNHSQTVSMLSGAMAEELGLPDRLVDRIKLAGVLHDIGKIGIPDAILLKPRALTDDEWGTMQTHPQIGAQILDSLELRDIREWVLDHHERPDGTGYPRGLAGEEIPIAARILAVADAFEAMIADRYYRRGQSIEHAVGELRRCSGTQFDARVVDALIRRLPTLDLGHGESHVTDEIAARRTDSDTGHSQAA